MLVSKDKNIFGQIFNLGGAEETTILNLAKKIIKITQSKSRISIVPYKKAFKKDYEDMLHRKPSLKKINRYIKYKAKYNLDLMIKEIIKFTKNEIN